MRAIEHRLVKLEHAIGVSRVVLRVFGTRAEADADTEPPPPGTTVVRIVTGVRRSPDARYCPAGRYRAKNGWWQIDWRRASRAYSFALRSRGGTLCSTHHLTNGQRVRWSGYCEHWLIASDANHNGVTT